MLNRLYNWYGKRVVWGVIFVLLILLGIVFVLEFQEAETNEETRTDTAGVHVAAVRELAAGADIELIGSVTAVSEASIRAEGSGRITRVGVELGDEIAAGTFIAELENASERAAVLQAEGVYEAALAGAAQSNVSVSDAQTQLKNARASGLNTYKTAFTTVDNVIRNLADELYANADSGIIGFRLDGPTSQLNDRRLALRDVLRVWGERSNSGETKYAEALLDQAEADTDSVSELLALLAQVVSDTDNKNSVIRGNTMENYQSRIAAARDNVNATLQSIEAARSSIEGAENALQRAEIGGTNAPVSSADAQVKQALGSLRAAQARLAKTIFRSPISGTVNALNVRTGDFVTSSGKVATIANNSAFLITTYVSAQERSRIAVGDTVRIAGSATGTITNIAPALDPDTKKIEVEIQTDGDRLSNGDTVHISVVSEPTSAPTTAEQITIPISALKVETDRVLVFTVSDEHTLITHEVTVGPLLGENVVIESGLSPEMEIVRDARGLSGGDVVEILQ